MDWRQKWSERDGWIVLAVSLFACVLFTSACERRGHSEKEAAAVKSTDPIPQAQSVEVAVEQIRLDPAQEDLGAPFAGLRVRTVGSAWGESERIVILLHGYGAEGDDLVPLATRFHERIPATYLLPEAPFALERGGRAWFSRDKKNFAQGLSFARALLEHCAREAPDKRFVVGGFSQGAMLTANLLAILPAQVVGALIFSPAPYLPTPPTDDSKRIPLFLSHGTADPVLPFAGGVALKEQLQNLGFGVTFVEFEGRHQIPQQVVAQASRFMQEVL